VCCQTALSCSIERWLHIHTSPANRALRQRNVTKVLTADLPLADHSRKTNVPSYSLLEGYEGFMKLEGRQPGLLREMNPIGQLTELEETVCMYRLMYL
jgi:hypothetical protein